MSDFFQSRASSLYDIAPIDRMFFSKDDEDENGGYYLCGWCEQDRQDAAETAENESRTTDSTIDFDV